ncbi:MAG: major facilitator superfamily 1 [Gammaproteobacteria bacterium]|nr:major facilitator superfamily 1 [Gammaproteobacteria bacterium]
MLAVLYVVRFMSRAIRVAIACTLCMSFGLAPLFIGTFPLFLQPVSRELGWGAAIYPQSALVAGAAGALAGPFVGMALDRFGIKPVMLAGLLTWSAALFALSWLNGSQVQLLSLSIVMGVTASACGPIALAKAIAGWFDRHRGLAMGIVLSAAPALATAIMVLVAGWLISAHGWRFSYRVLAITSACIAVPVTLLFMYEPPTAEARNRGGASGTEDASGATALQALGSRDFWMVMSLTALLCAAVSAIVSHFVAFSAERGIGNATATLALSAFSLVGPVGPLLSGALADRTRGPKPLALFFALPLIGLLLLVTFGPPVVVAAMVLMGVGFSACTGMLPYLLTRYFGVRHASQVFGVGLGMVTLSMGLGPVILGFARDQTKSFAPMTPALVTLLAAAVIISLLLRNYAVQRPQSLTSPT